MPFDDRVASMTYSNFKITCTYFPMENISFNFFFLFEFVFFFLNFISWFVFIVTNFLFFFCSLQYDFIRQSHQRLQSVAQILCNSFQCLLRWCHYSFCQSNSDQISLSLSSFVIVCIRMYHSLTLIRLVHKVNLWRIRILRLIHSTYKKNIYIRQVCALFII